MLKFNDSQFQTMSEIARDIAQVYFSTLVVGPFLIGFDKIDWVVVSSGGIVTGFFWFSSVWLVRKGVK